MKTLQFDYKKDDPREGYGPTQMTIKGSKGNYTTINIKNKDYDRIETIYYIGISEIDQVIEALTEIRNHIMEGESNEINS